MKGLSFVQSSFTHHYFGMVIHYMTNIIIKLDSRIVMRYKSA